MSARRLIFGLALAVIALLIYWIANNTTWEEISVPAPLRGEAAANPQYAAQVFLKSLGATVESKSTLLTTPPADGVVILSNWHWNLIDSRREKLEAWVKGGGRLVVDPSLTGLSPNFIDFTGIEHRYPQRSRNDGEDTELDTEVGADRDGCADWEISIGVATDSTRTQYLVCDGVAPGWLVSKHKPEWALTDKFGFQALRVAVDRGSVTLLNANPFGNRELDDADHGPLLVAATQLHRGDIVWLLTEANHPSMLVLMWRYAAPVVVLILLFVAATLWRSAVRFGPLAAPPESARRSLAELIRGSGWFTLRLGDGSTLHAAAVRALNESAARCISGYAHLAPAKQAATLADKTGIDSEQLQHALHGFANAAFKHSTRDLRRAIALVETARRRLSAHSSSTEVTHAT